MSLAVRKGDLGPSEDMYGEVEADAGVQGSFSPYSWAPLWAAVGAGLCFLGVAAGWWIFAFGVIFAIYGILLWVLEFSRGPTCPLTAFGVLSLIGDICFASLLDRLEVCTTPAPAR